MPDPTLVAVTDLGAGEREALALAAETPGTVLILGDALARRHAALLRLRLTGTAGVLLRAKHEGLLPAIAPALDRLETLRFRLHPATRRVIMRHPGEDGRAAQD